MQLWSIAMIDLRLTTGEFYRLTPRQFYALTLRHKDAREHTELLMGIVCATTANHSFNTPKKATCPLDYMPSRWADREAARENTPKRFNRKAFGAQLSAFAKSLPPTMVRHLPAPVVTETTDTEQTPDAN